MNEYRMIWTPPKLVQPDSGYRFSTDAFLLAAFAARMPAHTWCDLGTGSGAIAIALANEPRVIFADEPTGELDSRTASEVIDVLRRVNEENETTIVVVTHDPVLAGQVERTVAIRDGRLSSEVLRRRASGETGDHVVAEEFAVLDRVGRLQLPTEYVDALELEDRVRLTLDPDRINVFPDSDMSATGAQVDGDDQ